MSATKLPTRGRQSVGNERELRCETCGARCTRTPDGVEVGHKYRCPERPTHLPKGGGSGSGSYYRGRDAVDTDAKGWGE